MTGNPTIYLNHDWRLKMAVSLYAMKAAGQRLQTYEPVPPELKQLDDLIVAIGKDLVFISDEVVAGLDSLDAGRVSGPARSHVLLLAGGAR